MSYQVHHTQGIVISARNVGEANRILQIFTREFGLISAKVQSVRGISSKLRYGLQYFSHSNIDLIQGKEYWRVVNVEPIENFSSMIQDTQVLGVIGKTFLLLQRLLQGEERHVELFDELIAAAIFASSKIFPVKYIKSFESILALRILSHLGYWEGNENEWLTKEAYSPSVLERTAQLDMMLVKTINTSLEASQL